MGFVRVKTDADGGEEVWVNLSHVMIVRRTGKSMTLYLEAGKTETVEDAGMTLLILEALRGKSAG